MPQYILSLHTEIGFVITNRNFVDKSQDQCCDVNNILGQDQYDEIKMFYATNYSHSSYRDKSSG